MRTACLRSDRFQGPHLDFVDSCASATEAAAAAIAGAVAAVAGAAAGAAAWRSGNHHEGIKFTDMHHRCPNHDMERCGARSCSKDV